MSIEPLQALAMHRMFGSAMYVQVGGRADQGGLLQQYGGPLMMQNLVKLK
jgi:hypothetical protein